MFLLRVFWKYVGYIFNRSDIISESIWKPSWFTLELCHEENKKINPRHGGRLGRQPLDTYTDTHKYIPILSNTHRYTQIQTNKSDHTLIHRTYTTTHTQTNTQTYKPAHKPTDRRTHKHRQAHTNPQPLKHRNIIK